MVVVVAKHTQTRGSCVQAPTNDRLCLLRRWLAAQVLDTRTTATATSRATATATAPSPSSQSGAAPKLLPLEFPFGGGGDPGTRLWRSINAGIGFSG